MGEEREAIVAWLDAAAIVALQDAGRIMAKGPTESSTQQANIGMQVALAMTQAARRIEGGAHERLIATRDAVTDRVD